MCIKLSNFIVFIDNKKGIIVFIIPFLLLLNSYMLLNKIFNITQACFPILLIS